MSLKILKKFKNVHPEYPFSSHYIHIDGHRLHYIDEGEGSVIVMVHGNPTWSFFYRKLIHQLASGFRVIAFDHMGCGLSDKPQKYNYCLERHIENMSLLIKALNINTFSLIVHDWGGAIGFGYAVKNHHAIEKIVILNTAAFRSRRIPWQIRICSLPFIGEILVRGLNGFAVPATFMAVSKRLDRLTRYYFTMPYDSWENRIAVHRFVKDIPRNRRHPSYAVLQEIESSLHVIRQANIPMIILWGGKDFCFTKHFLMRWLEFFPEAEFTLFEHGGHYILEDNYDDIRPIINDFFFEGQ